MPSLRFLTVAGGRLAPDAVARWHARGEAWGGVELFVMYGQTEATARMAYLPPHLAPAHPGAIGVPIPGGHLALRPVAGQPDGVGELVYRGDNVMLGYAVDDADLAAGATLDELATGDLGRFDAAAGVFEIVGRRSRFVKPFGLRIDLDVVERELAATFGEVAVAGDDELVAVCAPGAAPAAVAEAARALTGLPAGCVAVVDGPLPRTERGKVDTAAVLAAARPVAAGVEAPAAERRRIRRPGLRDRAGAARRPADRHVRLPRRRLPQLRRVLAAPRAGRRRPPGRLAPPPGRRARTPHRRRPPARGADRHHGAAAGDRDLHHRRHPHAAALLPRWRPHPARRRRLQRQPLPPADRVDGRAGPGRCAHGRSRRRPDGRVGRRRHGRVRRLQHAARSCSSTTTSDHPGTATTTGTSGSSRSSPSSSC